MKVAASRALRMALAASAAGLVAAAPALALPPSAEWQFTARLDGRPIGSHRFTLVSAGGRSASLESEARFDVTLLGIPIYRYRHRASERWQAGCLASIEATTDDDGRVTRLRGRQEGGQSLEVEVRAAADGGDASPQAQRAPACTMSFAYWHPELASQRRLLDPGSGRLEPVTITPLREATIEVEGRPTSVRGLRIAGLPHPIDVWYAGTRWVGLDTTVAGGRKLTYRL